MDVCVCRASGIGTAGMAMTVLVFEGEKHKHIYHRDNSSIITYLQK